MRPVGVYGGTFNPIHVGHLRAAEETAEALGLGRVLFVPSAVPPHKAEEGGDPIASGAFGVPAGFAVAIIVSLLTPRNAPVIDRLVTYLRRG